jgi:hypothetical protein
LFLGSGLVANVNAVSIIAQAAGALLVSSAVFLILELSQPYTGVFRIRPTGVDALQRALEEAAAKAG